MKGRREVLRGMWMGARGHEYGRTQDRGHSFSLYGPTKAGK